MKLAARNYVVRIVAFVVLFSSLHSQVMAQRFGDGRILRRIFGVEESPVTVEQPELTRQPIPNPSTRKPTPADARYRANPSQTQRTPTQQRPTNQRRSGELEPLPLPPSARPGQATRTNRPPTPSARQQANRPTTNRRAASGRRAYTPKPSAIEPRRLPEEMSVQSPKDDRRIVEHAPFGVTVKARGKDLQVVRLKKEGMAEEAGVKVGDVLVSVGEMPLSQPGDIEQLDEVLSPGDRVEFEIVRKGKKLKKLVAFKENTDSFDASEFEAPEDDDKKQGPTLALNDLSPPSATASPDVDTEEVKQLRQQVSDQQQTIQTLLEKMEKLEREVKDESIDLSPMEAPSLPETQPEPKKQPYLILE